MGIDAGLDEIGQNGFEEAGVAAGIVAEVDAAVALVAYHSRLGLGGADEGESGGEGLTGEPCLHVGFEADAVLDEHDEGAGVEQGRQQGWEQRLVGGFQSHEHDVHLGHLAAVGVGVDLRQPEVAVAGEDAESVVADVFVVAME